MVCSASFPYIFRAEFILPIIWLFCRDLLFLVDVIGFSYWIFLALHCKEMLKYKKWLYLINTFQLSLEATAAACDATSPPVVVNNRNGMLVGQNRNSGFDDITSVPTLAADLRYLRPKKFTLKGKY